MKTAEEVLKSHVSIGRPDHAGMRNVSAECDNIIDAMEEYAKQTPKKMTIQALRQTLDEYEKFKVLATQRIADLEKQYPETKPFNDAEKKAFVDGFMHGAKWQQTQIAAEI